MAMGAFLDSFPPALFIGVHVVFLLVGVWAAKKARDYKLLYAPAFWLYVASQIVFLAFFLGGIFTLKMSVLLEQTLVFIMVLWIMMKARPAS